MGGGLEMTGDVIKRDKGITKSIQKTVSELRGTELLVCATKIKY